ncbi:glutaredoxin domain-containing protein [Thalassospiraceae bacterium LMO-JJ14]|nr:glutaredoxin domain-containing protein [Thalassospiraceae bacterium LMO-JJ14]
MSQLDAAGTPENLALPLKVYWQPGCSSCLKTKEFLLEHGVPFQSVNVLDDEQGFRELEALGVRLVPIVARGPVWANGAVFRDVAKVAGFEYGGHKMLTPEQLKDKVLMILDAAGRYLQQIPDDKLDVILPGRPRSYRQLVYHVFDIPKVFLDRVEHDTPYTYEALLSVLPDEMATKQDLLDYGAANRQRFAEWWERDGTGTDFKQPGKVYYGEVSLHEVLERTGWHSGQHTRQIMLMLREKLGIEPDGPLDDADFEGLPLPKNVWDNERSFDEASYDGDVKES